MPSKVHKTEFVEPYIFKGWYLNGTEVYLVRRAIPTHLRKYTRRHHYFLTFRSLDKAEKKLREIEDKIARLEARFEPEPVRSEVNETDLWSVFLNWRRV